MRAVGRYFPGLGSYFVAFDSDQKKSQWLLSALFALGILVPAGGAAAQGLALGAASKAAIIYDQASDPCGGNDAPDTPAVAFRNAKSQIVLFSSSFRNVALIGPSLRQMRRTCKSSFHASQNSDPSKLDDRTWIDAVFSTDGQVVYGLGSASYMPYRHGRTCSASDVKTACWYNGIALLKSVDAGMSFNYLNAPPKHLILAPPNPYTSSLKTQPGFTWATNLVLEGQYAYALVRRQALDGSSGTCLVRVKPSNWAAWEHWTGSSFSPSTTNSAVECASLGGRKSFPARGLYFSPSSRSWISIYDGRSNVPSARGIYLRVSKDLVTWQEPQLVLSIPLTARSDLSGKPFLAAFPSLLDENSTDRNFGTIGNRPSLIYVEGYSAMAPNGKVRTLRRLVMRSLVLK